MSEATVEIGDRWAKSISEAFIEWALEHDARNTDFKLTPLLKEAFYEAGEQQQKDLSALLQTDCSFNLRSPEAEKWIEEHAADRIKYINAAKKATIRQIVQHGFQEGLTSQEQSKLIREHIGLLPAHSRAVDNYRKNLLSSGMDSTSADKLTDKYRKKLLKYRADTIALSEGHTAANEGYRYTNKEALNRGIFPAGKYEQYWMVTRDKRLCPKCEAMGGVRADIDDGTFAGDGKGPPLHPRCRCTTGIIRKGKRYESYDSKKPRPSSELPNAKVSSSPTQPVTIATGKQKIGEKLPKR
jgi:hypothetical protein